MLSDYADVAAQLDTHSAPRTTPPSKLAFDHGSPASPNMSVALPPLLSDPREGFAVLLQGFLSSRGVTAEQVRPERLPQRAVGC